MDQQELRQSLEKSASFTFARSGGPGGQNVNKVNTKVFISIRLNCLEGISETERFRITSRLTARLDSEGALSISVEDERSQYRNREIALDRIEKIIIQANHQEKKRIPTKPGKAAKIRRLVAKKNRSGIKSNRTSPRNDD